MSTCRQAPDALDLGCGPAGAIELLAEWVGATGSVTAVDIDETHVTLARQSVQDRQLDNVEVPHADARNTGLPSGSFDVLHARLLLVNIPSPEAVVAEMVRLVKPGGALLADLVRSMRAKVVQGGIVADGDLARLDHQVCSTWPTPGP